MRREWVACEYSRVQSRVYRGNSLRSKRLIRFGIRRSASSKDYEPTSSTSYTTTVIDPEILQEVYRYDKEYCPHQGVKLNAFDTHVPLSPVPVQSLIDPVIGFPAGLYIKLYA